MKYLIPTILLAAGLMAAPVYTAQAQSSDTEETSRRGSGQGGGMGGGMGGPPQEAFTACEQKVETDSCTIETQRGTLEGTCAISPMDEALICRPEGGGRERGREREQDDHVDDDHAED